MADHTITATYDEVLRKLELTDPVHKDTLNVLFEKLINNDAFLRKATAEAGGVNIKWFGAKANDPNFNNTPAIKAAFNWAKANGYKKVFAPDGVWHFEPVSSARSGWSDDGVIIYRNMVLEGQGRETVFKAIPTQMNADNRYQGSWHGINIEEGGTIRKCRVDMSKDLVTVPDGTMERLMQGARIRVPGGSNITFEDFYVHNLLGYGQESFGTMTQQGSKNVRYIRCEAWDIEGTGLHVNGDWLSYRNPNYRTDLPADQRGLISDVIVEDCKLYDCTWQGISLYGADNVRLKNVVTYNCGHGINLEWSLNVTMHDCTSYHNEAGLGTYGKVDAKIYDCHFYSNGRKPPRWSGLGDQCEIKLMSGAWFRSVKGIPREGYSNYTPIDPNDPDTWPPRTASGIIEFHNCTVNPDPDKFHLLVVPNRANDPTAIITEGDNFPEGILINCPDAHEWKFKARDMTSSTRIGRFVPRMKFAGIPTLQTVPIGEIRDFTQTGGGGVRHVPYEGTGAKSTGATTFEFDYLYANSFSGYVLKRGRKYLVKIRYMLHDTNRYNLMMRDEFIAKESPNEIALEGGPSTLGKWIETEGIYSPMATDYRLQLQHNSSTPGKITVDYINVVELQSSQRQSHVKVEGENVVAQGTGEPTAGFWRIRDEIRMKSVLPGGYMGLVCIGNGWAKNDPSIKAWQPKTSYVHEFAGPDRIIKPTVDNGRFYRVAKSGRSTGVEPNWAPYYKDVTRDTGNAPAWTASQAKVVGNLVVPTVDNGFYYECTTAGNTGTTQPTWPTTEGATVTDGSVVWTAYPITEYMNAGSWAIFKPYGLISE